MLGSDTGLLCGTGLDKKSGGRPLVRSACEYRVVNVMLPRQTRGKRTAMRRRVVQMEGSKLEYINQYL